MGIALISNPPYNMNWNFPPFAQIQPRFSECELPPESNANYAFILTAISMITDKAVFLLPCGVLSTDNKQETKIRKYLVENNYVDCVIQLPANLFFGTSIATCIMVMKKGKSDNKILFIDATDECIKVTNNNKLTEENIKKI